LRNLISIFRNLGWPFLDQGVVSLSNFTINILLARFLGLEEFGTFVLLWMVVLFFNSLQQALIISPMMTIGPKLDCQCQQRYYGGLVRLQVIFSILSSLVIIICLVLADQFIIDIDNLFGYAFSLAFAGFSFQVQDYYRRYLYVKLEYGKVFTLDLIGYAGQVLSVWLIATRFGTSISAALQVIGIAYTASVVFGLVFFKSGAGGGTFRSIPEAFDRNWDFAKWQIGSALLLWTTRNYFIVATGQVMGASAVGILRAAQSLANVANVLLQGFENFVPAKCSLSFLNGGGPGLLRYLRRVALGGGSVVLFLAAALSTAPEFLLIGFFGEKMDGYGYVLVGFSLLVILSFFTMVSQAFLRTVDATKFIFYGYLLNSVFTLMLAKPLVSVFQLHGSVYGMVIAQSVLLLFYLVVSHRIVVSKDSSFIYEG
jgi:O-antigen/teichoic acid export membrane protein